MPQRGEAKPRKLPNGRWEIRWTNEQGKRPKLKFDTYNDALRELRANERVVEQVKRGERAPTPIDKTFDELCDYWLEKRATKKRSGKDDVSIIRRHLRPALEGYSLRLLAADTEPIEDLTEELLERVSDKTTNNILTVLISMLNLAEEKRWILRAPKIHKPSISEKDFRYLRTKAEIQKLLLAAADEGALVHALYATAIGTGLRAGELAGLQRDDIDMERRLITVQRSFTGPTKSGKVRHVPILDSTKSVLARWLLMCPHDVLVFPSERGTRQLPSARIFQDVLHRALDSAGFEKTVATRAGVPRTTRYITFHGLRHTFASHYMMDGGDLYRLQRILGHTSSVMTQRYAHLSPDAYAADYGRLGVVDGTSPQVIAFPVRTAS